MPTSAVRCTKKARKTVRKKARTLARAKISRSSRLRVDFSLFFLRCFLLFCVSSTFCANCSRFGIEGYWLNQSICGFYFTARLWSSSLGKSISYKSSAVGHQLWDFLFFEKSPCLKWDFHKMSGARNTKKKQKSFQNHARKTMQTTMKNLENGPTLEPRSRQKSS